MRVIPFAESIVCHSRAHCKTCRDTGEAGRAWREGQGRARKLPNDDVNFDCPFGVAWSATPPPPEPDPDLPILAEIDRLAEAGATGLGDTIEGWIKCVGIDRAVKKIEQWTGVGCGCDRRKEWLNKYFPYR